MSIMDSICKCKDPKKVPVYKSLLKKNVGFAKKIQPKQKIIYDRWRDNPRLKFMATPKKQPRFGRFKDELDLVLNTCYEHNQELFPEKTDIYYQSNTIETVKKPIQQGKQSKPIFQSQTFSHVSYSTNSFVDETRQTILNRPATFIPGKVDREEKKIDRLPMKYIQGYPLIVGGVLKRIHPSSIKLMNSSHHSPQTNAGYIRQDRDGNLFQY